MKNLFLLVALFIVTLHTSAQFPGGGKPGQAAPSIGHIYGKLIDSLGKPIEDASVVMLQNKHDSTSKKRKDVLLKAEVTKSNGEFNFSELPIFGPLKLKISAIGYKPLEKTVAFQMKMEAAAKPNGNSPAAKWVR